MKMKSLLIFFFLLSLFFSFEAFSNIKNDIIIRVENEIITNFEIKNKILSSLIISGLEINQKNISKLKKRAVEALVQSKLKKIELSKYKFKDDSLKLNQYLKEISSNDLNDLKQKFKENGLDYELFLEDIKIQFKWQTFIYKIYSKKIEVNEENIINELQDVIKDKTNITEFKIAEIEVSQEKNDDLNKKKLSFVKNEIQKNGFENTAINISTSESSINKGNLGWISSKSLSKNIFDALVNLEVGSVSEPIKRQNSFLILKLVDKRTIVSNEINIAKVKKNLINQKKNELYNLYSRSHLSKLQNTSFIEYKNDQ